MDLGNTRLNNNFDFLRLFFSSLVIISHSYPITGNPEILGGATNQETLGGIAIASFFIMSGFLIFISLQNSKSGVNYIWKRILRLFPGLVILLIFTLLVLPIIYKGENIFREYTYWRYFTKNITLYQIQYAVNGVFESNIYPKVINGSLWSLSYEFTMYLLVFLLFPIKRNTQVLVIILGTTFLINYTISLFFPALLTDIFMSFYLDTNQFYKLASYFFAGSLLSLLDLSRIKNWWVVFLICLLILSFPLNIYKFVSPLLLPVIILKIGLSNTPYINSISKKIGDLSYGIYIYGFLVQQLLMYYFELSILPLSFFSLFITSVLAWFSWNFIEKKALKLKDLI